MYAAQMRMAGAVWAGLFALLAGGTGWAQDAGKPWPIKVVVVTTFEPGEDTGDVAGEFQNWVEREGWTERVAFPGGVRPLRVNVTHDVLGVVTGTTLVNATASVMALGLDARFDLRKAYWLVNGIAGVDPADGTVGTAAWAAYVVGDVSRMIDEREAPKGWPYGLFAIGSMAPNTYPARVFVDNSYALNGGLTQWAYGMTRGLKLPENAAMVANRARWTGFPAALKAPEVMVGDSFAADDYWHGAVMTQYANDWVKLWTHGKGNFVMTNMEDSGIAEALVRLDRMHRVDYQRLMVLRVGSNFCEQGPGRTALESVTAPYLASTALEIAWLVGSTVEHELVKGWSRYEGQVPSAP